MQTSYLFIVNPNSNSGKTHKKWDHHDLPKIRETLPNSAWAFTNGQGNASTIASYGKKLGYDVVVAVGGDGTINEVINGLFGNILEKNNSIPKINGFIPQQQEKFPHSDLNSKSLLIQQNRTALGIIPNGTGCDFIKTLKIPNNFDAALNILQADKRQSCNVGKIQFSLNQGMQLTETRYFINIASFGASGETVKLVNNHKNKFGAKFTFWLAAIKTILKNKTNNVKIYYDNNHAVARNTQVVFICNAIYCGGGMKIAQDALIDDELLNITEIQKISRLRSVLLTSRLYSGDFSGLESFIHLRTVKKVRVDTCQEDNILVECDGEQPGILPAEFTLAEKNIEIIC